MDPRPTLAEALDALAIDPLLTALDGADAYAVGGWVREVIAGRDPGGDLDVAVDGDLEALLARLDPALEIEVHAEHRRFGTATVELGGLHVDLTRTRRETYARPGALPDVEPAPIDEDLRRRDFTVNAIAVSLRAPHDLLDPYDGAADIDAAVLRVLHDGSFTDDPTRALRAARYCARLGLEPDRHTLELLRATDLGTVSTDRRDGELGRLAGEAKAPAGFRLLAEWGLLPLDEARLTLIEAVDAVAPTTPWPEERATAILLVAAGGEALDSALRLSRTEVDRPSEGVRLGRGHSRAELLVATAAGCGWLAEFANEWSAVELEISGEDLLSAGIPEGPAIGAALREALERKLDGGLHGGRDAELELALALARRAG